MQVLVLTFFIFSFASFCSCSRLLPAIPNKNRYSVIDYGAVGDGTTDDSQAFLKAWGDACAKSDSIATIEVPNGKTFLLNPITFTGPCKFSSINFKVEGNIVAPSSTDAWSNDKSKWIEFSNIDALIMNGDGQINGNGALWWKSCHDDSCERPKALFFNSCNNLRLSGIHHLNSPKIHISIVNSNHVTISDLVIMAPKDSPNTDGIDIRESKYIVINNCTIATGDDCIAMNTGTSNINITKVACGPGHGISIGSLGKNGAYETVENVYVSNCNFYGTTNGVRIKTWKEGSGYVRNVTFQQITFENTKNPIIINQNYRDEDIIMNEMKNEGEGVKISGVTYKNVNGTSASKVAIDLDCSSSKRCDDILMDEIKIISESSSSKTIASCNNVDGEESSVLPYVPCLNNKIT